MMSIKGFIDLKGGQNGARLRIAYQHNAYYIISMFCIPPTKLKIKYITSRLFTPKLTLLCIV